MTKLVLPDSAGPKDGLHYSRVVLKGMRDHINLQWKKQDLGIIPPPASIEMAKKIFLDQQRANAKPASTPEGFCLDESHRAYKLATGIGCSCPKCVRHPDCDRFEIRGGLPAENPWKTN